ncbi:hypothetical protein Trydic_g14381 [Trypoxylus dichotomus]
MSLVGKRSQVSRLKRRRTSQDVLSANVDDASKTAVHKRNVNNNTASVRTESAAVRKRSTRIRASRTLLARPAAGSRNVPTESRAGIYLLGPVN